jgi:hypothetical protein
MQDEQARPRLGSVSGQFATSNTAASTTSPDILDKLWFAHVAGKTYGPYSGHEIKRMAAAGRMIQSDFLCPEGGSAWIEAGNETSLGYLFHTDAAMPVQSILPNAPPFPSRAQKLELPSNLTPDSRTVPQVTTWTSKIFGRGYSAVFQRTDQDRIREDLREYFGPRADKYLEIYEKMRTGKDTGTRNWIVFVTTFPWYFYRKMYITGTLLIFLPALLNYLFGFTGNVGVAVALCMTANKQYVFSGISRLKKADALGLRNEERREYLRRAGGVSLVAGVLSGIFFAAIAVLAFAGAYLKHHKAIH